MNKFLKLFSAFLVSLLVGTTVFATIPAPAVQIHNYANGGKYFVKSNQRIPITPVGCKKTEPIRMTMTSYESADRQNPQEGIYDVRSQNFNYTNYPGYIGADTIYTTSAGHGITDVSSTYFKSYEYTLTCTPASGGSEVERKVTFVVQRDNKHKPLLDGNSPLYERCNNPVTNEGLRVSIVVGRTLDNNVEWKFESDASYQPLPITETYPTDYKYKFYRLDYQVLDGNYLFRFNYLDYFDGTNIVSGGSSDDYRVALQRKVGSPLLDQNSFIKSGIVLAVNDNSKSGFTEVCENDKVSLKWLDWDKYFSNPAVRDNWTFQWQKEYQGGNYIALANDQNNYQIGPNDFAPNYRIKFIPKGNSVGCENDAVSAGSYMNETFLTAYLRPIAKPVIVGDSKVCPDGSIDLTINKPATATDVIWNNLTSNVSTTADKYTVTAAGSYTVRYIDSSVKNSFNEVCSSPTVTQVVTSYNKPVAPTVLSSDGKTKYCSNDFKSATLKASSDWNEAAISSWTWTTTSTSAGVASSNTYVTKGFGTYNVTYKDAFGCVSEKSADFVVAPIAIPATPTIRLVGNAVNCTTNDAGVANTVGFDVTSPALPGAPTYQWFLGTTVVQNSTANTLRNIATSGDITLKQVDPTTLCVSDASSPINVTFQANPTFTGASISKEAYTLYAKGFDQALADQYVWKVGSTVLGNAMTQKISGTGAAEYSVAQYKSYTIKGSTIKCLSVATKYSYVPDPDFSGVIVYPNPASTSLKIDVLSDNWSGATTLTVYDMIGRVMLTRSVASFPVNISDLGLSNGMYVLNLDSSNGNAFQTKLVINK